MPLGNAGPLGLFSFALTTFVISCYNAGILGVRAKDPVNAIVGLALFYGGLAQAIAGMWEFRRGNTFGGTAFASYGAFWLSYGALLVPWFGVEEAYGKYDDSILQHAKAIYLLGWTIFTLIMTFACFRIGSVKLSILFVFVFITFVLLTTAEFGNFENVHRAAGFVGLVTAALAWYNALGDLLKNPTQSPSLHHRKSQISDSHHHQTPKESIHNTELPASLNNV